MYVRFFLYNNVFITIIILKVLAWFAWYNIHIISFLMLKSFHSVKLYLEYIMCFLSDEAQMPCHQFLHGYPSSSILGRPR
ncbi:hypothetical protein Y032_0082g1569 [Ancylostoma ceylanicum]|uniref:Uncharacterized protein n=1 Tax=Ancylostoma ceylanicum TaxID=53326 RepID=A0A016TRM3_9BILA|nr:hypothetical protein Y032_0082g1569 [Ancylostoma ceylanicum]